MGEWDSCWVLDSYRDVLIVQHGEYSQYFVITVNAVEPLKIVFKKLYRDFPGGAVVKNPPANTGHTGLIPALGRSHMMQSN